MVVHQWLLDSRSVQVINSEDWFLMAWLYYGNAERNLFEEIQLAALLSCFFFFPCNSKRIGNLSDALSYHSVYFWQFTKE